MDRGVIASPGIITPLDQGFRMERSISPEELRYYVMYWDKVVIPGNNLVYIGVPEEEDLISCGAIERPRVGFQGSYQGDQITYAILSCQSIVASHLVHDKSADWVIHQIGKTGVYPEQFNQQRNIIRVDLANVLPVPNAETPINEVLEFKERRSSELKELHDALDEFYEQILSAPDPDLASKKAVSRLQESILTLDKVSNEKFERSRRFDFSAELNLSGKDISVGASSGAIIDFLATGFTIPVATIVGAIASTIKIKSRATSTFQPASENTKLAYLSYASQEGVIGESS